MSDSSSAVLNDLIVFAKLLRDELMTSKGYPTRESNHFDTLLAPVVSRAAALAGVPDPFAGPVDASTVAAPGLAGAKPPPGKAPPTGQPQLYDVQIGLQPILKNLTHDEVNAAIGKTWAPFTVLYAGTREVVKEFIPF